MLFRLHRFGWGTSRPPTTTNPFPQRICCLEVVDRNLGTGSKIHRPAESIINPNLHGNQSLIINHQSSIINQSILIDLIGDLFWPVRMSHYPVRCGMAFRVQCSAQCAGPDLLVDGNDIWAPHLDPGPSVLVMESWGITSIFCIGEKISIKIPQLAEWFKIECG